MNAHVYKMYSCPGAEGHVLLSDRPCVFVNRPTNALRPNIKRTFSFPRHRTTCTTSFSFISVLAFPLPPFLYFSLPDPVNCSLMIADTE